MDNSGIQLFGSDANDIAMPSIGTELSEEQQGLMSESISKAISGETVKTLLLPEDTEIAPLNYIFDFTDLTSINTVQKEALKGLVSYYGDVQLYLYKQKSGLTAFGMGDRYKLERMVPLIRSYIFNNEIKIYRNFAPGNPVEEVDTKDITRMRLNL